MNGSVNNEIEFFFDFASPYSYLASCKLDGLAKATGRVIRWRPFMLGPIFKASGNTMLLSQPLKGQYAINDLPRFARFQDTPLSFPDTFPISTLAAARAFYWLEINDAAKAIPFAKAAFHTYFGEGRDITPREVVVEIAVALGVDGDALLDGISNEAIKQKVKDVTEEALQRGVCGAPFFFVGDEGFWGADRMWMVKKWCQKGGW